ncbi:hypothetical protein BU25DRAFT_481987 [Macroventuria anomochaeta]|uniref:Uncharacterized protein n=1 Tax=Macroventuria anomochaeta TaxID=301207 RepID=A0ACB6RKG7_9PLEO|nr:uncharacterized protein BU25DRAFT_481987 [Macroventuria anomochaeta]KAF2621837.1 hypothetical protein BU25DRAFT_481987 [Macroventuria anomochaeta]
MRNLASGTSDELSPTCNKARNKLGYHRTSVACDICLHTQENIGDFHPPYHGVSASAPNTLYKYSGGLGIDPNHTPTSSGVPVQHAAYPYPPPIETQWLPTTCYLPSSTIAESPNSNAGHWRQSPSTANSVYGSKSGASCVHTPATMSTSSYGHPESHAWGQQPPFQPPPTQSMSYGNIEGALRSEGFVRALTRAATACAKPDSVSQTPTECASCNSTSQPIVERRARRLGRCANTPNGFQSFFRAAVSMSGPTTKTETHSGGRMV